jgi:hypothetical protein
MSRTYGILDVLSPCFPSLPVTGLALLFLPTLQLRYEVPFCDISLLSLHCYFCDIKSLLLPFHTFTLWYSTGLKRNRKFCHPIDGGTRLQFRFSVALCDVLHRRS